MKSLLVGLCCLVGSSAFADMSCSGSQGSLTIAGSSKVSISFVPLHAPPYTYVGSEESSDGSAFSQVVYKLVGENGEAATLKVSSTPLFTLRNCGRGFCPDPVDPPAPVPNAHKAATLQTAEAVYEFDCTVE